MSELRGGSDGTGRAVSRSGKSLVTVGPGVVIAGDPVIEVWALGFEGGGQMRTFRGPYAGVQSREYANLLWRYL
jgi:hypothetical protein